jgi:hypothetical protein
MAFGNPLISTTPADDNDIYSSQADTYGNAFGNPINYANQNSGWGIDPSLLTPSYTAPYRPHYGGPNGMGPYGHPGFFGGLGQIAGLYDDPRWGDPFMHQQNSIDDVSNRPMDAAMWGMQRIGLPIAAFGLGGPIAQGLGLNWKFGARFGSGIGGGIASSFGAQSSGLRSTWNTIKTAHQAEGLMGAARAIKNVGVGGFLNLGARGLVGGATGLAVGFGAPLLIGEGLIKSAEKGIVDPYINTRMSATDLRRNFSGITFGDATGNAITGKGLGFEESTKMSQKITDDGIRDMNFGDDEYRMGADLIGRSGLLDNANKSQIVSRIKEDMKQIKLIMSIASMPEIKDAVEQLAKLQMAGASTQGGLLSNASFAMRNLSGYATMAGTTVQRLMNTVGAQGQYLYQANGMTPYLGQLAAGASYSSLAAAQRMGVVSTEQIARMGGLEGATQASLTGQINASQTLYNKMALHNNFLGGAEGTSAGTGRQQDAINVIQKFGHNMANDPLKVYGEMMMYGRQMAGKQLELRGSLAVEDQIMSRVPQWLLDENGKLSAERAVPFLLQSGMNQDEIQAYFAQRIGETDPKTYAARQKALKANGAERMRQYISDTGAYGGAIGSSIYYTKKFGRDMTVASKQTLVDPVTRFTGRVGDSLQRTTDYLWYGASITNKEEDINSILSKPVEDKMRLLNIKVTANEDNEEERHGNLPKHSFRDYIVARDVNSLIKSQAEGSQLAQEMLTEKDPVKRHEKLYNLLNSEDLKHSTYWHTDLKTYTKNADNLSRLNNYFDNLSRVVLPKELAKQNTEFAQELEKTDGLQVKDKFETLQDIGSAIEIATNKNLNLGNAESMMKSNETLQKFAKKRRITDGGKALEEARKVAIRARETGIDSFATVASKLDVKDYKDSDEALKTTHEIVGGVHVNAMPQAGKISQDEAIGAVAEAEHYALERKKIYDLNKEGRIDFTTTRQALTQIDNSESISKFDKAVDKFVDGVNQKKSDDNRPKIPKTGFDKAWDYLKSNQRRSGGD